MTHCCCPAARGRGEWEVEGVGFEFKLCPFGKKGRGVMATVGQPLRRRGGSVPTGRHVRSPRASQRLHPRLDPAEERGCPSEGLQVIPRFALTPYRPLKPILRSSGASYCRDTGSCNPHLRAIRSQRDGRAGSLPGAGRTAGRGAEPHCPPGPCSPGAQPAGGAGRAGPHI